MRELEKLNFLELVLAEDAAGVSPRGAGFGTEARGPGGDEDREDVFGKGFVAVEVVEFDFRGRREPEIGVLDAKEVRGEFRQLAGAEQRRTVDQERRQNFGVSVLPCVHVEKEVGQ